MSDREMLELAAKAAGIDAVWVEWTTGRSSEFGCIKYTKHAGLRLGGRVWNPLEDDGDALRLAVKLFLWEAVRDGYRNVNGDNDFYAATRRAITRAAAEIQRNRSKA